MSCFAVGLIAYTMDDVRVLAMGEAVVRTYVAPAPEVLCVAVMGMTTLVVHVNTAVLPTVTVEPPPLATTAHVANVGNVYIDVVGTTQDTTVRVDANVNVSVCCTAVAVTVAPRTLGDTNVVASDTGMVGVLATERMLVLAPDKKVPMAVFRVLFVLLKVNCVCVALDAMSEYPSPSVEMTTVSGTASVECPEVIREVVCPEGAVTVTTNWSAPICVPSLIVLMSTSRVAGRYVYDTTTPETSVPPIHTRTAPVAATSFVLFGLGSTFSSDKTTADVYVCPAAKFVVVAPDTVSTACTPVGNAYTWSAVASVCG
jgi:hypothetical protein